MVELFAHMYYMKFIDKTQKTNYVCLDGDTGQSICGMVSNDNPTRDCVKFRTLNKDENMYIDGINLQKYRNRELQDNSWYFVKIG